jgi:hypothetical protein
MSVPEPSTQANPIQASRDDAYWAKPISKLRVSDVPTGALNLNLDGHEMVGPLQGFGRMWQRTYRLKLKGVPVTPAQVVQNWKENFARFQPPENHFYPSLAGVKPGALVFINTTLPIFPGTRGVVPIAAGVMVLYADEESFTVMTPKGFPIAGWNFFSAYEEEGCTVVQVQALVRASDPVYEFGFRFMGGEPAEDQVWFHVLKTLGAHWGVNADVEFHKTCLDPKIQWGQWKNVWQNAAIRTTFYVIASPLRWVRNRGK